ncbi:MAG: hypothetical protein ACYDAQ_00380 [Mycobacteriales bacterium]
MTMASRVARGRLIGFVGLAFVICWLASGAQAGSGIRGKAAAGAWHTWVGISGDNAGHGVVSKGEAIWSNYLFDDYGANVDGFDSMAPDVLIAIMSPHVYPNDPLHPVGFAPSGNVGRFRHTGDYSYPPDKRYPQDPVNDPLGDNNSYQNVANVAETRIAVDARSVYFRFSLSDLGGDPSLTVPVPDSTVIGLAIDTDPNQKSGGGPWPFGANLKSSGWKSFLTVWGTGGALTYPNGGTRSLAAIGGAIRENLATNTIEVRVPRVAIAAAGRTRWSLIGGAGRWDAGHQTWAVPLPTTTQSTSPGSLLVYPRVYELLFHHNEPNSLWDDTKQANDLVKDAVDSDNWMVNLSQLQHGDTVAVPCQPGPKEETFTAYGPGPRTQMGLLTLPTQNGGVSNLHNVNYIYRWHVQPLAVMLPPSVCDPRAPRPSLDYFFHPANVNQNAWFVGVEGDHAHVTYLHDPPLGFAYVTQLAARYNRITASGLAHTEGWNYGDAPGEQVADWDAFQAVIHRYRINPDHVRVVGMSGRLGAPFFAERWPDRVASMFTVSNHTADSPAVVNLRNTPWFFTHGTQFLELDSDLPSYAALDNHLNALGYQYVHTTWNTRGHDFNMVDQAYGLAEPWTAASRIHPARITYYLDPRQPVFGVPLFPGVDWVRTVTVADNHRPATFDLTDLAKANQLPVRETRFDCFFTNVGTSDYVEYHGLSYATPAVVRSRMPDRVASGWLANSCAITVTPLRRPQLANAVAGTIQNLSSVTLDLDQMGLDPKRPIDLSGVRTTRPVTLHLLSARGDRTVVLAASAAGSGGVSRLASRAGTPSLAATGEGPWLPALALTLLAGALVAERARVRRRG